MPDTEEMMMWGGVKEMGRWELCWLPFVFFKKT